MDPQEIQNKIDNLQSQIDELKKTFSLTYKQKLRLDNALPDSVTYYVATGATGPTQTPLTFKDGILQSNT